MLLRPRKNTVFGKLNHFRNKILLIDRTPIIPPSFHSIVNRLHVQLNIHLEMTNSSGFVSASSICLTVFHKCTHRQRNDHHFGSGFQSPQIPPDNKNVCAGLRTGITRAFSVTMVNDNVNLLFNNRESMCENRNT